MVKANLKKDRAGHRKSVEKTVKKAVLAGLLCIAVIVLAVFMMSEDAESEVEVSVVRLGYCPTMQEVAENIQWSGPVVLVKFGSAAEVLKGLGSGSIDVALIGRVAKSSEVGSAQERRLGSGFTLVNGVKMTVHSSELKDMRVHTYLNEEITHSMLPESDIVFHDDILSASGYGPGEAMLMSWDDYEDKYELFVVIDDIGKDMRFRIPVLYSLAYDLDKFEVVVDED